MMTRKRPALNIGLGKMLSQSGATLNVSASPEQLRHVALEMITPGKYQPRRDFDTDSLEELAESIKAQGILQPIVLRQTKPQHYEIIAGERRWRAAQLAGLSKIPAMIKEISDEAALAIGLIENIQREDLNALEEASALQRLIDEFHLTHEEVSSSVGKSRAMVTNLLRLLQLDPAVKTLLENGSLEMGHARALLGLTGHAQVMLAKEVVAKKLSVRETEARVRDQSNRAAVKKVGKKIALDPNLAKLQQTLSENLGTRVHFLHQKTGAGKVVIDYPNLEVLEGILEKIGG